MRQIVELWNHLVLLLPRLFNTKTYPSLLHGDLHRYNFGEVAFTGDNATNTTFEPCLFDPCSFYGHNEYDLACGTIVGGIPSEFYQAYHKVFPQDQNFKWRQSVYKLFTHLNYW